MDLALFALGHLLLLAALAATAWSAGTLAVPFLTAGEAGKEGSGERIPAAFRLALGFAILCQLHLLLGLTGQLRLLPIVLLLVAIHLAAAWLYLDRRQLVASHSVRRWPRSSWVVGALLALPVFALALYPPLGFDQTLYHLPMAKAFAASGGMPFLGDLRFPVFPQLAEVLQAGMLVLAGEIASQLPGYFALLAGLGLLAAWVAEKAGQEAGFFAAAMVLGSPCAVYIATCGYVEPQLALFALAALFAAERSELGGGPGWVLAAGFFAGSAAATKYHGLFFLPLAGLCLLRREDWRLAAKKLAIYAGAALATAGPSYVRIVAYTGNPLFPFYSEIFGSGPWTEESMLPRGVGRWQRVLTLFWDLVFRRDEVGHLPPWSPIFLLALPLAVVAFHFRDLRRPALLAVLFWLVSPTHGHYLLTIAGCWALVIAVGLHRLLAKTPQRRRLLAGAAILLALGGPAYAIYRIRLLGPPAASKSGQDALLTRQLPLYAAVLFLDREAAGARVMSAGPVVARMASYFDGALLGDLNGVDGVPHMTERVAALGSLAPALEEIGATWILLDRQEMAWLEQAERDPRLEKVYEDPNARIYRLRFPRHGAPESR